MRIPLHLLKITLDKYRKCMYICVELNNHLTFKTSYHVTTHYYRSYNFNSHWYIYRFITDSLHWLRYPDEQGGKFINHSKLPIMKSIDFNSLVECIFNLKRGIVVGYRNSDDSYLLRHKDGTQVWYPSFSLRLLR